MQKAELILYDNLCVFKPIIPQVTDKLVIWEKNIIKNKIKVTPKRIYAESKQGGELVGATYQGFWQHIMTAYARAGYMPEIKDVRLSNNLPAPAVDKMYGFRFSQQKLLTDGLMAQRSGLIGAPTRYGKTCLIVNTLRAFPLATACLIAPGVDLVQQLYEDLTGKFGIPGRKVHLVTGSKKLKGPLAKGDVVVCSVDSLAKLNPADYDLLLADEPHALVTADRMKLIDAFPRARRIGFGATLKGRFDGRDKLIEGIFGPVIVERTYKEAVAEGAICPLKIIFFDIEIPPRRFYNRNQAYDYFLFKNRTVAELTSKICSEVIPDDFQTLIFVKHEKQADVYQDAIGRDTSIAMAKRMTNKERIEMTDLLRSNTIKRCLCTRIYVQGVTFSDVRVLINAEAGGNNTSAIQKPGRLAEIRPGKKCGIIIDFFFKLAADEDEDPLSSKALIGDSKNRQTAYKEKGYDIIHVSSIEQLKTTFNELI